VGGQNRQPASEASHGSPSRPPPLEHLTEQLCTPEKLTGTAEGVNYVTSGRLTCTSDVKQSMSAHEHVHAVHLSAPEWRSEQLHGELGYQRGSDLQVMKP